MSKKKTPHDIKNEEQTPLEKRLEENIHLLVTELKTTNSAKRARESIIYIQKYAELTEENDLTVYCPLETEYELKKIPEKKFRKTDLVYDNDYYNNNLKLAKRFNHRFCNISKYLASRYKLVNNKNMYHKVSLETSISLAENFLKEYDDDIYNYFMKIKDNDIYLCKMDDSGRTLASNHLIKSYILFEPSCTIGDSFTLVHETIHSYLDSKMPPMNDTEKNTYYSNNFLEVYSIFSELVFYDYLKKIKYNNDDIDKYYKIIVSILCDSLDEYKNSNYLDPNSQRLGYGYVIAYHFYDQYCKDKEKAKENIYNFMMNFKSKKIDYMLNNYGLNEIDLLNPQKIEKHVRKKIRKEQ